MGEKKVSTKLLLKTSFWYTISNFLTHGMAFITMPIFTRLMSKAEYGDFSVYANWQQLLVIICGIEVTATLNRARFDFQKKDEFNEYITSCLFLTTMTTGFFIIMYVLLPSVFDKLFLIKREYMIVMFAYLLTFPAFSMFIVKNRIEYKYKLSATISITITVVSSLIALAMVLSFQSDRTFGRIIGQYSLSILAGAIFYISFLRKSVKIKKEYIKYAFRIGLPLVFSYLASRILLTSDTIVLKHMCSAEEVSYLSVSHSASQIIMLFVQALNISWSPWLYDMLKLKEYSSIKKVYSLFLWTVTALTLCILLIGPEVINILASSKYKEALYLLPPYILSGVFTAFTSSFGYLETYYKKPEISAVLTGAVAVLNIGLDIMGVNLFGYRAVCYATVICQVLLVVLHYLFTRKYDIQKILPFRIMVSILLVSIVLIPISLLIYTRNTIRFATIIIITIVLFIVLFLNRNKIFRLIDKKKKREKPIKD